MKRSNQRDEERLAEATGLTGLLADTYLLYNTTQFYHWNVEGPQFRALHAMFEEQYRELAEAVDLLAERIRVLGFYTPGTLGELVRISRLSQEANVHDAATMLRHLSEAHLQVSHRIRHLLTVAEKAMDEGTLDLLAERLRVHEKAAWMIRTQAGEPSSELKAAGATLRSASA